MFKILMIDDEKSYHSLYKEIITEELNVEISFATNGLEALSTLEGTIKFDLLILDLDMPKLDGKSTLHNIRKKPAFKNVPIFILTANSSDENQTELLNMGANDFISKGCTPEIFIARLKALVLYKEVADKYNSASNTYEQLLESILTYLKVNLTKIIEDIEQEKYSNDESWFKNKSRYLNDLDKIICKTIDKIESPEKNIRLMETNFHELSQELEKRRLVQFPQSKNFIIEQGLTNPNLIKIKVDADIFFMIICLITNNHNLDNKPTLSKEGFLIFPNISPHNDFIQKINSLANHTEITILKDKKDLVLRFEGSKSERTK